jgi:hypothetical protein
VYGVRRGYLRRASEHNDTCGCPIDEDLVQFSIDDECSFGLGFFAAKYLWNYSSGELCVGIVERRGLLGSYFMCEAEPTSLYVDGQNMRTLSDWIYGNNRRFQHRLQICDGVEQDRRVLCQRFLVYLWNLFDESAPLLGYFQKLSE